MSRTIASIPPRELYTGSHVFPHTIPLFLAVPRPKLIPTYRQPHYRATHVDLRCSPYQQRKGQGISQGVTHILTDIYHPSMDVPFSLEHCFLVIGDTGPLVKDLYYHIDNPVTKGSLPTSHNIFWFGESINERFLEGWKYYISPQTTIVFSQYVIVSYVARTLKIPRRTYHSPRVLARAMDH